MVMSKPPYDATVENVRKICQECRDVSGVEHDDLEEEVDDLSGTTFDRNLEAAVLLGLFDKNEDNLYTPTRRGKRIGYGPENGEETEIFKGVVRENEFYNQLLDIVGDELTENEEERYLSRDDVMREIGINFNFDVGDRTLEAASATFLRVLDAAGLGTYTRGSSGHPTRLVINDEFMRFAESSVGEQVSQEEEEIKDDEVDSSDDSTEEDELKGDTEFINQEGGGDPQEESRGTDTEIKREVIEEVENDSINVQVNIDISSSDWGSEDVIEFLEAIQSE